MLLSRSLGGHRRHLGVDLSTWLRANKRVLNCPLGASIDRRKLDILKSLLCVAVSRRIRPNDRKDVVEASIGLGQRDLLRVHLQPLGKHVVSEPRRGRLVYCCVYWLSYGTSNASRSSSSDAASKRARRTG